MSFETDISVILENEGGKVDDPRDPGGRTNKGITNKVYRAWKNDPTADVWDATDEEINAIYKQNYWDASNCSNIAEPLALVVFDTAVNCGVTRAKRILDTVLKVDDSNTLHICMLYLDARSQFYNNLVHQKPNLSVFLRGWQNRVTKIRKLCLNYQPEPPSQQFFTMRNMAPPGP